MSLFDNLFNKKSSTTTTNPSTSKLSYPTRNEARGILTSLASRNRQSSTSVRDLCAYSILCYQNKHNITFVTFAFTNALVDMFPRMNVNDENFVDTSTMLNKATAENIDNFFVNHVGSKLEEFIQRLTPEERSYNIELTNSGATSYNRTWFNNSDQFIYPLLASYQDFKKQKGMLFQKDDIKQVPIDYSIAICYNHYSQVGFLNKSICSDIIKTFTDAANDCLNTENLKYDDIEYNVFKDITNPRSVKAAFEFIKQL